MTPAPASPSRAAAKPMHYATRKKARTAKLVWFVGAKRHRPMLHFLPAADTKGRYWDNVVEHGTLRSVAACGLDADFTAPGMFARMGDKRCPKCCAVVGIPEGFGTPCNDESLA